MTLLVIAGAVILAWMVWAFVVLRRVRKHLEWFCKEMDRIKPNDGP